MSASRAAFRSIVSFLFLEEIANNSQIENFSQIDLSSSYLRACLANIQKLKTFSLPYLKM